MVKNHRQMMSELGWACASLHNHYLANFKKPKNQQTDSIVGTFGREHFLHDKGRLFVVTWEDLFLMFNLNALDAGLVRCFTL